MPISPGLGIIIPAGVSYYRITSLACATASVMLGMAVRISWAVPGRS